MTRKQALTLAIAALSASGDNEEAVQVLHTLRDELPLNRWSDTAIRDSIEQFILDHGRPPTVSDFKKRGLPPHPVIKNKYGVTLSEWLRKNYPVINSSLKETRAAATKEFIQEYLRIRPNSAEDYNKNRTPGSACWYTIARYNQTRNWRSLLTKLELPVFSHVAVPSVKREYYVQFEAELDEMKPTEKQVLKKMVEENHPAFPSPNFQVVQEKDKQDPYVEHFILRYVTDKRLAFEAMKSVGEE